MLAISSFFLVCLLALFLSPNKHTCIPYHTINSFASCFFGVTNTNNQICSLLTTTDMFEMCLPIANWGPRVYSWYSLNMPCVCVCMLWMKNANKQNWKHLQSSTHASKGDTELTDTLGKSERQKEIWYSWIQAKC